MGRGRRHLPPFELEVAQLGPKGLGQGVHEDGHAVLVRGAPPGSRIKVVPFKRKKGVVHARRVEMVRPPYAHAAPRCAQFGLCGGCTLQELQLHAQRAEKQAMGLRDVLEPMGLDAAQVRIHPIVGTEAAYGYRNKVELSFGPTRYLSEAAHREGQALDGRFLGFHAPGRFDRVVDAERCELVSEAVNAVIAVVRKHTLHDDAPVPYHPRTHEGFWRHLTLRQAHRTGQILVGLYTGVPPEGGAEAVEAVARALLDAELPDGARVRGVVWGVNEGVADVARGVTRGVWGEPLIEEWLGDTRFELSLESFFQTNTKGAELLYDTIGEALGGDAETLLDLYCGAGSIGLYLRHKVQQIIGVEVVEEAVQDARRNAERNGVANATYRVAKLEDALDVIPQGGKGVATVVDPPRVGLHPKVARRLAKLQTDALVYVACKPGSLGRDGAILLEGGWKLTDLWTVDLFPHTGHVEMVARFER